MALTMKQKNFCNEYVKTGNATESYLATYSGSSRSAARIESSKLLQRDDISDYIQNTLLKPIQNRIQNGVITEREKIKDILWNRLELAIEREDDTTIIKITDQINRMNAEYVNVNRNIDDTTPDISNIDTNTLLRLVE